MDFWDLDYLTAYKISMERIFESLKASDFHEAPLWHKGIVLDCQSKGPHI